MPRISLAVALCTTILAACGAAHPPKPDLVPKELIPAGFSADECHVVKPAEAMTESGPDGRPVMTGTRSPEVACQKPGQSITITKSVPVCHTKGAKELPLSDCCMSDSGEPIPACTPKLQPLGE